MSQDVPKEPEIKTKEDFVEPVLEANTQEEIEVSSFGSHQKLNKQVSQLQIVLKEEVISTPDVRKNKANLESLLDQLDVARQNSAFYSAIADSTKQA